jgi:hypothetical protein
MAVQVDGNTKTFAAAEVLAVFRRVKVNTSGTIEYADAGEAFDGVTQRKALAIGDHTAIKLKNSAGTFKVTAAGAITRGANVYGADDGKVSTTESGSTQFKALEAASADGDVIEAALL